MDHKELRTLRRKNAHLQIIHTFLLTILTQMCRHDQRYLSDIKQDSPAWIILRQHYLIWLLLTKSGVRAIQRWK